MKRYLFILFFITHILSAQTNILERAELLLSKGSYKEVISLLEGKLENNPKDYKLWFNLGTAYQQLLNYGKAREAFYQAYEFEKFDISLLQSIGRNYVCLGAPNYALLFFEQAFEIDNESMSVMVELAGCYYDVRKHERARDIYIRLSEADTVNAYYLKQLAHCYYKLGDYSKAISLFEKSFQINPSDANVAYQLAGLLVNGGDLVKAMSIVKTGLFHNDGSLPLNKLAAETLFKMKRYDDARLQYELLINSGDSIAANYQKLGFCNYFVESVKDLNQEVPDSIKFLGTIKAFKKTIEKDSTDALAYVYLGISYKERNNYSLAIEYLEKGISLTYPNYLADAYSQLGYSYYLNEKFSEAIKSYKKALEYEPDRNSITFHLASVYDKYYQDRGVPIMYYERFLSKSKEEDQIMREYAEARIEYLKERKHFNN